MSVTDSGPNRPNPFPVEHIGTGRSQWTSFVTLTLQVCGSGLPCWFERCSLSASHIRHEDCSSKEATINTSIRLAVTKSELCSKGTAVIPLGCILYSYYVINIQMCERKQWLDTDVWAAAVTRYRLWTTAVTRYRLWTTAVTRYRCVDSCD